MPEERSGGLARRVKREPFGTKRTSPWRYRRKLDVVNALIAYDAASLRRETGIYARNGLDAQLIYFNSGSTAVTALITWRHADLADRWPAACINATMNGARTP